MMQMQDVQCVMLPAFQGPLLVLMLVRTNVDDSCAQPSSSADAPASSPANVKCLEPELLQAVVEVSVCVCV